MNMTDPMFGTYTGTRYHRHDCETLNVAASRGQMREISVQDVADESLTPCGVCKPARIVLDLITPEIVNLTVMARHIMHAVDAYATVCGDDGEALERAKILNALTDAWAGMLGLSVTDAMRYAAHLHSNDLSTKPTTAAVLPF